jgi:hypothetical protein
MLSVVMLNVTYAECHIQALYAECHYVECHYAGFRGALRVESHRRLHLGEFKLS